MIHQESLRPSHISKQTLNKCSAKYPTVLTRVYATKNPKLSSKEALDEDEWRYVALPGLLRSGESMTKQQLARLVKWKITHGTYRPFLPGMIQKNSDAEVKTHTSRAAAILRERPTNPSSGNDNPKSGKTDVDADADEAYKTIEAALKEVTNLKGVGPATGTLVLSVYAPERVPFFADELFHWIVPEYGAKLKYDKKEYGMLWRGVRKLVARWAEGSLDAREIEKAAYVIQHIDQLTEERGEILKSAGIVLNSAGPDPIDTEGDDQQGSTKEEEEQRDAKEKIGKRGKTSKNAKTSRNAMQTKRKAEEEEGSGKMTVTRRSKRVKT